MREREREEGGVGFIERELRTTWLIDLLLMTCNFMKQCLIDAAKDFIFYISRLFFLTTFTVSESLLSLLIFFPSWSSLSL